MKSKLALWDTRELRIFSGFLTILLLLGKITDLSFSFGAYLFVLVLLIFTKAEEVQEVREGLSDVNVENKQEIIILQRIYLRNDKKFHRKVYLFNRFITFFLMAWIAIYDILVNMKVIDPI